MNSLRVALTFGNEIRIGPYEVALREAGLEPVRNPESLASLGGLLLSGGADINPALYGQERTFESDAADDQRDALETHLLREALAADIPVFAICRGLQLFNVVCGGTLVQHLASTPVHRQKPQNSESGKHPAAHRIWVAPNTRLAEIIGPGGHDVNSRHHQAVDRMAEGLNVSAISEDGVIEGLEKPGAAFAIAVQWHPEDRIFVNDEDRKLFAAFAEAVALNSKSSSRAGHRAAPQPS